jgi:NAD+ kinase
MAKKLQATKKKTAKKNPLPKADGKVLIFPKRDDARAAKAAKELESWLQKQGLSVVVPPASDDALIPRSTLAGVRFAVVIGGDGTFLTFVRRLEIKDAFPILGINLGSLGFITDIAPEEMLAAVGAVLEKKYEEELRPLLQVEICRKDTCRVSGTAFNDAVITKDARTAMLKFDVRLGEDFLTFVRADGYIVATPTGSTAYSLSVGGPLLHPGVGGIVLVPICSHSLSSRPVVVPQDLLVEIRPKEFNGKVYLVLDGQINLEIEQQDHIRIRRAPAQLRLVRFVKTAWFEALRAKLHLK